MSDLNAILSSECSYEPVVVTVGCICLYNVFCSGIIQVNTVGYHLLEQGNIYLIQAN